MSATQASPRRVIGAVVATGIMSFCGVIVETAMNITFPALMSHFGIVTSSLQWMTTLDLLVVVSITPLSETAVELISNTRIMSCRPGKAEPLGHRSQTSRPSKVKPPILISILRRGRSHHAPAPPWRPESSGFLLTILVRQVTTTSDDRVSLRAPTQIASNE